jgi:hypothetical protein
MQDDSHEIFPSPLENPSDSVYPVMDISDFATDNGQLQLSSFPHLYNFSSMSMIYM